MLKDLEEIIENWLKVQVCTLRLSHASLDTMSNHTKPHRTTGHMAVFGANFQFGRHQSPNAGREQALRHRQQDVEGQHGRHRLKPDGAGGYQAGRTAGAVEESKRAFGSDSER